MVFLASMKINTYILIALILFASVWNSQQEETNGLALIKQPFIKQSLEITRYETAEIVAGIQFELIAKGKWIDLECMAREAKLFTIISEVINYLYDSDNNKSLHTAWSLFANFFENIWNALKSWVIQHIKLKLETIIKIFLIPYRLEYWIGKIIWYSYDITRHIIELKSNFKSKKYYDAGKNIGWLIRIAGEILKTNYEYLLTKEHAFLDGFTQEFAPEIYNHLEMCIILDNELIFTQIESEILKINKFSSKTEISEITKNITNIYLKVANSEICNFGDIPMFLNVVNNKYSEWNPSLSLVESCAESDEFEIDYLLQAKEHFESKRFISAGKILGKFAHSEINKI